MKPKGTVSKSAIIFFFTLLLSACELSFAQDVAPPPGSELSLEAATPEPIVFPSTAIDLARGEALYALNCAPCHGFSGLGDGEQSGELPAAAAPIGDPELARQRAPQDWYAVISRGNLERFMPPFSGSLSVDERWDVLAYVYRLSQPARLDDPIEDIYIENCAECHGNTGRGDGPAANDFDAGMMDFTDLQASVAQTQSDYYAATREGAGEDMPAFSELTDEQSWALAAYIQAFSFGIQDLPTVQVAEEESGGESGQLEELVFLAQVINGSGGELSQGTEITLHAFDQIEERYSQRGVTRENGRLEFEAIAASDDLLYIVSVDYAGLTYFSEILSAQDADQQGQLEFFITVYDSTRDTSTLRVERINIVVEFPEAQRVQIVQQVLISNSGDRAVAPGEDGEALLRYALPPEAGNPSFEAGAMGERYLIIEGGFADLRAVLPGENSYQLLFAFDLPYRRAADYQHPINLPTEDILLFLPVGNVELEGENFASIGEQVIEGISYQAYRLIELPEVGEFVNISLRGPHPITGSGLSALAADRNFLLGLLALTAALGYVWFWLRRASSAPQAIMDAIIDLDEEFDRGEIAKNSHAKQRSKLKKQLQRALKNGKKID